MDQISVGRIVSEVKGVSVKLRDILEYDTDYTYADLTGEQLITKNILTAVAGTGPVEVSVGSGDDQNYDYAYDGNVGAEGLFIYAEQLYTDPDLGENVWIPYSCNYKKVPSTNHIILIRSDPGDTVKFTIKP